MLFCSEDWITFDMIIPYGYKPDFRQEVLWYGDVCPGLCRSSGLFTNPYKICHKYFNLRTS